MRTIVDQVNDLAKGLDRVARNSRRIKGFSPGAPIAAGSAAPRPFPDPVELRRREV